MVVSDRIPFQIVSERIHDSVGRMRIKTATDIGALVRDRRAVLQWSQEELARRAGISRLWIVQLERERPPPRSDSFCGSSRNSE